MRVKNLVRLDSRWLELLISVKRVAVLSSYSETGNVPGARRITQYEMCYLYFKIGLFKNTSSGLLEKIKK